MPNKKKTSKSSLKKRVKPVKSTVKKPAKTKKAKAAPSKKIRARVSQGQLPKRPADSNAAATDKSKKSSAGKSGADRKDGSAGKSGKPVVIHNAPTVSVSSKGGSVGDFDFSSRTKSTSKIKEWSGPNGLDYSVPEEPSRKAGRSSRADDDDGYDYPMGMAHPPAHYTLNFEPHIKPEFHANSYGTYNAKGSHVSKSSKTTKPTRVIVNKPAIRKYKPPEFKENKVGKSVLNFTVPEQRQPVNVDIAPEPPLAPHRPRPAFGYSRTNAISISPLYTQDYSNESKEELDDLPPLPPVKEEPLPPVKEEPEDNNMIVEYGPGNQVVEYDPEVQVASGLTADLMGLTGKLEIVPSRRQQRNEQRFQERKRIKPVKVKRSGIQPMKLKYRNIEKPGDRSLTDSQRIRTTRVPRTYSEAAVNKNTTAFISERDIQSDYFKPKMKDKVVSADAQATKRQNTTTMLYDPEDDSVAQLQQQIGENRDWDEL